MLVKRLTYTAVFALLVSVVGYGVPTLAQSEDDRDGTVRQQKHEGQGWERADNGAWVNPADDPRYPGASPSVGVVETGDDMDADGFKPEALLNNGVEDVDDDSGVIITQETTTTPDVQEPMDTSVDTTQDTTVDTTQDTTVDTTRDDTMTPDVDTTTSDVQTDAEIPTTIDNSAVESRTATDTTVRSRTASTRRHTRLD
jgi:hypothetical protein